MTSKITNKAYKYSSESEIETLVSAFSDRTLPRSEWNHAAHLSVALWYLAHYQEREAVEMICDRIQSYNTAIGIKNTENSGYPDTLTLFWFYLVRNCISINQEICSLLELANGLIEIYNDKHLALQYYSRDLLMSWEARESWVEPDLKVIEQSN
ncbi:MAG: hypothetical protein ACFB02_22395 [Mastigocoleus sp.]